MNLTEIAKATLKFSPVIATAMGSPIAGMIASLLATAFGVEPKDLANTITNDPNAEFKLKQFELEHTEALTKIAADNYSTEVDDRKNARDREIQQEKITGKVDWVLSGIAIMVVIGFFSLCAMNYLLPVRDDHVLIMLIGQISSGFVMVLSFYFGSSKKGN
jgi:hypothetical protein